MPNKSEIERFYSALALAIYDKLIETAGVKILFFYDADVVIKLVLGFEHESPSGAISAADYAPQEGGAKERIVRALLSTEQLGPFYLLRSHLFEFYELIRQQPQYQSERERARFLERARSYFETAGIAVELENLAAIVRESEKTGKHAQDAAATQFLNVLQEGSAENFALIEQINGTWDQRLRRYNDQGLLGLDHLGPEIQEVMQDTRSNLTSIYDVVLEKRPDRPLNAFHDAAALATLAIYVSEWRAKKSTFVARFSTETHRLAEAMREPKVAELLSYPEIALPVADFVPPPGAHSVYRNSDYFIMRAIIEELSPLNPNPTLDELIPVIDWAREIKGYLEEEPSSDSSQGTALFSQGRLAELLRSFEKIGLLKQFWFKDQLTKFLARSDTIANWMSVFRYARDEFPRQILYSQISDIKNQVQQEVSQLRTLARNFNMLVKAREDRRKSLANNMENPMRDLGLVRWGYDPDTPETMMIGNIIGSLATSDDSALPVLARDIAERMESAKRNIPDCRIMVAVLWALARYSDVVFIVDICRQHNTDKGAEFPRSLLLLRLAALMRTGNVVSEQQRREKIQEAEKILQSSSDPAKKHLYLSAGYIIFHAWKQQMLPFPEPMRKPELQSEEVRGWAEKSFDMGERAYGCLPPNSLAWAYAINHCAYVGSITGAHPEKTRDFVLRLSRLEGIASLWNPRFDDTMGIYYLLQAQRRWDSSTLEERNESDVRSDLAMTKEYLDRAKRRDPGDVDIEEHLVMLRIFSTEIRDYGQSRKNVTDS